MKFKTCGRDTSCELVIEHPTVSRLHARIELAEDGLLVLKDADSSNGMYLNRNDSWIRASRVTLCAGDRIRFGDCEVALERLTAVFGNRSNARLGAMHFPVRKRHSGAALNTDRKTPVDPLHKPRRNPATGKIEDETT
jgi:pSer/pThr/pTyr-binding forkhead associated (FHA) protein